MVEKNDKTNEKRYYPTNDYCFKRLFGHKGNEVITQGLIEGILGYKCDIVEVTSDEVTEKDMGYDKVGILDVYVKLEDGTRINLEMQMVSYETILKRVLFYWAKKYIESIKSGQTYESLEATKVILIANFEIKELNKFEDTISSFKIIEEKERKIILTEDLEIVIIELPKMKKRGTERKDAINWIKFIENPNSIGGDVLEKNKALNKAKEEYEMILSDKRERTLIELREKYMLDMNTLKSESLRRGAREGYDKGAREGYDKGQKEVKLQVARKLLSMDMKKEDIKKATGLTSEEIEKLTTDK